MGIDAQMLVRTKHHNITAEIVRDIAYDLASSFGADRFFIDRSRRWNGAHALELITEYHQDGETLYPGPDEHFIEVHLWTRYYGKGYERGDLPFIISVAEWLERRIPDSQIWYGGDSSGVVAQPFDRRARSHLFDHFVSVNHRPYVSGWGDGALSRTCDFCDKPMIRYGYGGRYAAFNCPGCGFNEETRDDGATWSEPDRTKE